MTDQKPTLPRLRVGPGPSDASGGLCAMQVVSWENGDTKITDLPTCADPFLARVVQGVNDRICSHREGDLLCPDCSVQVLDLAHRTVGTALDMPADESARVYTRLALDEAESVARDDEDERVTEARRVTAAWLDGAASSGEARAAAAYAFAIVAASAASYAAYSAAAADNYAGSAAYAANAANAAADVDADRLGRAHRLIDRFEALTGVRGRVPEPEVTATAIAAMTGPTAYIGAREAADLLGVNRSTLSRLVRKGAVPVVMQMPGETGARLFDPKEIRRIKRERSKAASRWSPAPRTAAGNRPGTSSHSTT